VPIDLSRHLPLTIVIDQPATMGAFDHRQVPERIGIALGR
jgi:hypothetical protein